MFKPQSESRPQPPEKKDIDLISQEERKILRNFFGVYFPHTERKHKYGASSHVRTHQSSPIAVMPVRPDTVRLLNIPEIYLMGSYTMEMWDEAEANPDYRFLVTKLAESAESAKGFGLDSRIVLEQERNMGPIHVFFEVDVPYDPSAVGQVSSVLTETVNKRTSPADEVRRTIEQFESLNNKK